ncbi:MAG: 30S ribosome-binding factor RbfA [Thermotogota bacterium]|nr:30S ribosome-binding factor RbfA [Thermotogota bacterium]
MTSEHRIEMLESEIKKVLAHALREYKDDDLKPVEISFVRVKLSGDKSFADVFVSTLGSDEHKERVVERLKENKGYFRTAIAKNIRLFKAPEIRFKKDIGLDASMRVSKILKQIEEERKERENNEKS